MNSLSKGSIMYLVSIMLMQRIKEVSALYLLNISTYRSKYYFHCLSLLCLSPSPFLSISVGSLVLYENRSQQTAGNYEENHFPLSYFVLLYTVCLLSRCLTSISLFFSFSLTHSFGRWTVFCSP